MTVIEGFDVVEDFGFGLAMSGEIAAVDPLDFEGAPEAFHGSIVATIAPPAHGSNKARGGECLAKVASGILDASIGMEKQALGGITVEHGQ